MAEPFVTILIEKGARMMSETIRRYMACHMKAASFALHVANGVKRQLCQWDSTAIFYIDHHTNFFLLYGQAFGKPFQLLLTLAEVEVFKAEEPYALDRYIWRELREQGLPVGQID
ncbi:MULTISPECIES: hypothetical protein [Anoxybacillaceae]|uniref:hypothetical protein n=1 Tax=Anoxybacillaceae TaxID=3120669 RepID=UPI001F0A9525|nr:MULTISPECIES: hypothetical protein [Anoxybacillus]